MTIAKNAPLERIAGQDAGPLSGPEKESRRVFEAGWGSLQAQFRAEKARFQKFVCTGHLVCETPALVDTAARGGDGALRCAP